MQKHNLSRQWMPLFAYFCVVLLCVVTSPKVGITDHTVDADATASAERTGQNGVWSTFKAKAVAWIYLPPSEAGVYELEARVTGKKPVKTGQQPVSMSSGYSRRIEVEKTYRAWGSGSSMRFSAKSEATIVSTAGDAEDRASANYPD